MNTATTQARRLNPPISFRSTAVPLRDVDWRRGYTFGTYCDEQPGGHAYCDPPYDLADRAVPDGLTSVWPFTVYLPVACRGPVVDPAELLAEQRDTLEKATDYALARELWSGTIRAGNPSDGAPLALANDGVDVGGVAQTAISSAFALLLEARYGVSSTVDMATGGVWHLPPQLVPAALAENQVVQVQNAYFGPMGWPVVTDVGYAPVANDGPGAGDTKIWMWLTGPVRYAVDDIEVDPDEDARTFNPRTNLFQAWASRLAVVEVDPCGIVGYGFAAIPQTVS